MPGEFKEGDHPRAENGQFGTGGGYSKAELSTGHKAVRQEPSKSARAKGVKTYFVTKGADERHMIIHDKDGAVLAPHKYWDNHPTLPGARLSQSGVYKKELNPDESETKHADLHNALRKAEGYNKPAQDEGLALDRDSVRSLDKDGRLHVAESNITKANICPYYGHEIPGYEKLGLDKDRIYKLLRDPEELRKAAPTFNNLPILSKHVPVSADAHPAELVIGSTGTDAKFSEPFMSNSLVFWPKEAINDIKSKVKQELSSAYHYDPDMTPGAYKGEAYDGVMRNIVGNHVALVKEGRAGPDVVVGDESIQTADEGGPAATANALSTPKGAQDMAVKNRHQRRALAADAKRLVAKLAKDANLDDVTKLLEALENHGVEETGQDDMEDMDGSELDDASMDADPMEAAKKAVAAHLEGKVSPEDIAKVHELMCPAKAEDEEAVEEMDMPKKEKVVKKEKEPAADMENPAKGNEPGPAMKPDMVSKKAMDSAIADAVKRANEAQKAIRIAEDAVRPYMGKMAVAYDSAEDVYRAALTAHGVDVKSVDPSAFPAMLKLVPLPGGKSTPAVAMDANATSSFLSRIPDAARIGNLG